MVILSLPLTIPNRQPGLPGRLLRDDQRHVQPRAARTHHPPAQPLLDEDPHREPAGHEWRDLGGVLQNQ